MKQWGTDHVLPISDVGVNGKLPVTEKGLLPYIRPLSGLLKPLALMEFAKTWSVPTALIGLVCSDGQ
ncbi:MAG: hypothetical protein COC19_00770 [SAR86 cluster bacterium]|uniref:Uncharacterized protein n=1 Tax=SAR86 cluster bacterium TaxID=2030880 RepID=A0A2A4MV06_9GAMM|nr:MAG: hypothetical protein COC19_00770 [SAR86 cluster bacterium]